MRFNFMLTFLAPSDSETPFVRQTASFQVRDFKNEDGTISDDCLLLKTKNPEALNRFVEATGLEGLRLPLSYGRSAKMKVSKAALLKGASKQFPNNGMITNVEFQNDNMDMHRVQYPSSYDQSHDSDD